MRSAAPAETSGRSFECSCKSPWSSARLQFTAGLRQRDRSARLVPAADSRSSRNGTDSSDLARMETAVPVDQRPATQLKELRDSQLYSWVCISGYATQQECALPFFLVQDVEELLLSTLFTAGYPGEGCLPQTSRGPFHKLILLAGRPDRVSDF